MSQIGEPQRFIISEPMFEPVPQKPEQPHVDQPQPEPEQVPAE
jgi:hypothetical protein